MIADLATLNTLPDREFCSGLAEVVKYGLISDPELFRWLEGNMDRVVRRDTDALSYVVKRYWPLAAGVKAASFVVVSGRCWVGLSLTLYSQ